MRILFQGDSITDGNRGRTPDPNHIMGHGFAFSIASELGFDYPGRFEFINRGVSGDTSELLLKRWQTDAVELQPDVVSLLIGTNDGSHRLTPAQYEDNLRQLAAALPQSRFILCEPFRFQGKLSDEEWREVGGLLRQYQAIVRKLSIEWQAPFIPLQAEFESLLKQAPITYWIWDGIHPTVAGHELMTRQWLKGTKEILRIH